MTRPRTRRGAPSAAGRRSRAVSVCAATLLVAAPLTAVTVVTAPSASAACAPNNRFGRMFPTLPAAQHTVADLEKVGALTTETTHQESVSGLPGISQDESDIPAGYTYAGQFVDHDITLDPRPNDLTSFVDPATLVNNRTPSLDLDSVYGRGPAGSPQLYEADGMRLRLGARLSGAVTDPGARDVLRDAAGRAVLGDGRNDENRIIGSLHAIMTRLHNRLAGEIDAANPSWTNAQVYEAARRQVTWHYQWALLTDFLPRMSSPAEVAKVVRRGASGWTTSLALYDACAGSMPVEFSAAAYRWHTMVRDDYEINPSVRDLPIFNRSGNPRTNLAGGSPAPRDFGEDWDLFFEMTDEDPQDAYKLDNSLVPALAQLPTGEAGTGTTNLSTRNLLRGRQLGLPSGQAIARSLGLTPLADDKVIVGPALGVGAPTQALTSVSSSFAGNAPLWTYMFAESVNAKYTVSGGKIRTGTSQSLRLGPVGARIVNETVVGLLAADPDSVLNHPEFTPSTALSASAGTVTFASMIRAGTGMPAKRAVRAAYASSSVEDTLWGTARVVDGKLTGTLHPYGWSSSGQVTQNHPEWLTVDLAGYPMLSAVTLHPRGDNGQEGQGFPVDFTIEVSTDGEQWSTVVTRTGYATPTKAPQVFPITPQRVRYVKVTGTRLRPNPKDGNRYRMQFSEVFGTSVVENGDIELPALPTGSSVLAQGGLTGWHSKAPDGTVTVTRGGPWDASRPGAGQVLALLGDDLTHGIQQDVASRPGGKVTWSFWVRGTGSVRQYVVVRLGRPSSTTLTTTSTCYDVADAWKRCTGSYTVPSGQTTTRVEIAPGTVRTTGAVLDDLVVEST